MFKVSVNEGELSDVISKCLNKGYKVSAKHDFQLFEILTIQNQEFVFNIDLMHPQEDGMREKFVDQFDLGIYLNNEQTKTVKMKSILGPNTDILFKELCSEKNILSYKDDGKELKVEIPIINELGCILSKAISCSKAKRQRDSLDIYLSIKQARDYSKLISNTIKLKDSYAVEFKAIEELRLRYDDKTIYNNIVEYQNIHKLPEVNQEEFHEVMQKYFNDIK